MHMELWHQKINSPVARSAPAAVVTTFLSLFDPFVAGWQAEKFSTHKRWQKGRDCNFQRILASECHYGRRSIDGPTQTDACNQNPADKARRWMGLPRLYWASACFNCWLTKDSDFTCSISNTTNNFFILAMSSKIDLLPWFDLYQYFGSLQRGYFQEGDDAKTIVLEAKKFLLKGYKLRPKRRLRTDESIRVSGESLQHKPQFLFLLLKYVVKSLLKLLQFPKSK